MANRLLKFLLVFSLWSHFLNWAGNTIKIIIKVFINFTWLIRVGNLGVCGVFYTVCASIWTYLPELLGTQARTIIGFARVLSQLNETIADKKKMTQRTLKSNVLASPVRILTLERYREDQHGSLHGGCNLQNAECRTRLQYTFSEEKRMSLSLSNFRDD